MKHAILGAGGVGGLIGACLARSGASVTMVLRPESLAHYPAQLQLESPFGNFSVPVAVMSETTTIATVVIRRRLPSAVTRTGCPARTWWAVTGHAAESAS